MGRFIAFIHERLHGGVSLVEILLRFLLADALFKAVDLIELADCASIKLVNAFECFLAQSFLIICKE